MDHGHRRASCDTSLVVSGSADCRRRRRNVYDKKPQRYAKDNNLTARSDKSVAYVTNIKRLCSTFRTIEANYRKTQSISRPLCNSRATCISIQLCHSFRYRFYEVPSPQLCNCSTIILTFVVAVAVVVAVAAAAAAAAGKGRKYNI